ncbi:MAG: hypothetical protein ACOCWO_02645 [Candidatus Muiribacteriaceae bacterium]
MYDQNRIRVNLLGIPLPVYTHILIIAASALTCLLLFFTAGRYIHFLQEGILWLPFLGMYLYIRYIYNKRTHPEPLYLIIDNDGVDFPLIRTIPFTGTRYSREDIEKVYFNFSTGKRGRVYFTSTLFILKNGNSIKLSIALVPVSTVRNQLEERGYRFFAKKDNSVKKIFILLLIVMIIMIIYLYISVMGPDLTGGLFDF